MIYRGFFAFLRVKVAARKFTVSVEKTLWR